MSQRKNPFDLPPVLRKTKDWNQPGSPLYPERRYTFESLKDDASTIAYVILAIFVLVLIFG